MTYREATTQAQRECGMTELQIKNAQDYADLMNPNTAIDAKIPPKKERETIDSIKRLYKMTASLNEDEYDGLKRDLDEWRINNAKKN